MKNSLFEQAASFLREQKNNRRWLTVVLCLAVVVVFGTVWALTLQGEALTHTEKVLNCTVEVHQHDKSCYDKDHNLICGYADYVVHTHNADCYDADGNLVCPLPEIKEHKHTKDCYQEEQVLVCTLEESDGHQHTSDCYVKERGELICGQEEGEDHQHTDECYEWIDVLTCGLEEGEGAHHHTADCYETVQTLICGQLELHTHNKSCYDKDGNLICGQVELLEHVHDSHCFEIVEVTDEEVEEELAAANESADAEDNSDSDTSDAEEPSESDVEPAENDNDAAPADETPAENDAEEAPADETPAENDAEETPAEDVPTVAETDAENTDANDTDAENNDSPAAEQPEAEEPEATVEMPAVNFSGKAGDVKVTVTAPEGAFPVGTTMVVKEVKDNQILDAAADAVDGDAVQVQAVDITFYDVNGVEIEPVKEINVTLVSEALAQAEEAVVVHVEDNGDATVVEETVTDVDAKEISFDTDAFSVYAIVYTVDFTYDGYTYSIPGGDSITLKEILNELGIIDSVLDGKYDPADVESVEFSDESLIQVTKNEKILWVFGNDDWVLKSLQPFNSLETLTVTMKDGKKIVVNVTDDQTITNLGDTLVSAEINGTSAGGTADLKVGEKYTVKLEFQENENFQFNMDAPLTYQLPAGVTIPQTLTGVIEDEDAQNRKIYAIKYTITTDGLITYEWVVRDQEKFDSIVKKSKTTFIKQDIEVEYDGTQTQLEWKSGLTTNVNADRTHDVEVKKDSYFDPSDQKMHYTVHVKSSGTSENVVVKDTITGTALTFDQNVTTASTITNTVSQTSDGFTATISKLTGGQEVTYEYTASVNLDTIIQAGAADNKYGTKETTGNTVELQSVTGDDSNLDNNKSETYNDHDISISTVKKSGEASKDVTDGKRTVTWTVTVNEEQLKSLAGTDFVDTINDDSTGIMSYSGTGIEVQRMSRDQYGNMLPVVDSFHVNWGESGLTNPTTGDAKTFTYTFPSADSENAYAYKITYTTEVDVREIIADTEVHNTGTTRYGGTTGGGKVGPTEENKVDMVKSVSSVDIPSKTIEWDISFQVPAAGLSECVVTDTLPNLWIGGSDNPYTYQGYYDQIKEYTITGLLDGEDATVTTQKQTVPAVDSKEESKDFDKEIIFTFTKNGQSGLLNGNAARTVNIHLVTEIPEEWLDAVKDGVVDSNYAYHTNNAKILANGKTVERSATANVNTAEPSMVKKMTNGSFAPQLNEDGSWSNGFYYNKNDETVPIYQYRIYLYGINEDSFTDGVLTIKDIFPSKYFDVMDSSYTQAVGHGSIGPYLNKLSYATEIAGNQDIEHSVALNPVIEGDTITYTISQDQIQKNGDNYYPEYAITYFLNVKDAATLEKMKQDAIANGGILKLKNVAEWALSDGAEVEVDYGVPVLSKEKAKVADENNTYQFTVKINQAGEMLGTDDTLTVTDTVSNLSVDYDSITFSDPEAVLSYINSNNTITFTIKNGTPLTITYKAIVLKSGDFSNVVELNGQSAKQTGNENVSHGGSSGIERIPTLRVIKHAEGNMGAKLDGAEFALYRYDDTKENKYDPDAKPIATYTSVNGGFTIGEHKIEFDAKYTLVETKAPEGYEITHPYYFTVSSTEADYSQYIYLQNDIMPIEDKLTPEDETTIAVSKVWKNAEGQDITSTITEPVTVHLYKKAEGSTSRADAIEVDSYTLTSVDLQNGVWKHTFEHLTAGEVYFITEDPVPGYRVTYSNNNYLGLGRSGEITVTNTEKQQPDATDISVVKAWQDQDGNAADAPDNVESITVKLQRQYLESATIHVKTNYGNDALPAEDVSVPTLMPGTKVKVTYIGGGENGSFALFSTDWTIVNQWNNGTNSVEVTIPTGFDQDLNFNRPDDKTIDDFQFTVTPPDGVEIAYADDTAYNGSAPVKTLSDANNWKTAFTDLPLEDTGKCYQYYIEEVSVNYTDGTTKTAEDAYGYANILYKTGSDDFALGADSAIVSDSGVNTITVANRYEADGPVDVTVEKSWVNADGTKTWPAGVEVKVKLYTTSDGGNTLTPVEDAAEKTLTATSTGDALKWTDLPKLENGTSYVVREESVTKNGKDISSVFPLQKAIVDRNTAKLTNTEDTIDLGLTKTWRTETGGNDSIRYTIYRTTTAPTYYNVIFTYPTAVVTTTTDDNGHTITTTTTGTAQKTFKAMKGTQLKLIVTHPWYDTADIYKVTVNNSELANSQKINEFTINYQKYIERAFYIDNVNGNLNITLEYANSQDVSTFLEPVIDIQLQEGHESEWQDEVVKRSVVWSGDAAQSTWETIAANNLPKYKVEADGTIKPYYYYVLEESLNVDQITNVKRFEARYPTDAINASNTANPTLAIDNTQRPEYTWLEVQKVWPGDDASSNTRIYLYRRLKDTTDTPQLYDSVLLDATVDESTHKFAWKAGWYTLDPKYDYFIREQVDWVWSDAQTGFGWKAVFEQDGSTINGETIGSDPNAFYPVSSGEVTITNKSTTMKFHKLWEDGSKPQYNNDQNNKDKRIYVTVHLERYIDGVKDASFANEVAGQQKKVVGYDRYSDDNNVSRNTGDWEYTWKELPLDDGNGHEYTYKVVEDEVYYPYNADGTDREDNDRFITDQFYYLRSADGLTITNYPNLTDVIVEKTWKDGAAPDEHAEWSATFTLQRKTRKIAEDHVLLETPGDWSEDWSDVTTNYKGETLGTITVTNDTVVEDKFQTSVQDLPKYETDANGDVYEIKYQVVEAPVTVDGEVSTVYTGTVKQEGDKDNAYRTVIENAKGAVINIPVVKNWAPKPDGELPEVNLILLRYTKNPEGGGQGGSGGETPDEKGNLTITKTFAGDLTSAPTGFDATYTITGPDSYSSTVSWAQFSNGSYTLNGLKVGSYTVTETVNSSAPDGYTVTNSGSPATVNVPKDGTGTATFTSNYTQNGQGGGGGGSGDSDATYTLTVQSGLMNGDSPQQSKSFQFSGGTNITLTISCGEWVWSNESGIHHDVIVDGTTYEFRSGTSISIPITMNGDKTAVFSNTGWTNWSWFTIEASATNRSNAPARRSIPARAPAQQDPAPIVAREGYTQDTAFAQKVTLKNEPLYDVFKDLPQYAAPDTPYYYYIYEDTSGLPSGYKPSYNYQWVDASAVTSGYAQSIVVTNKQQVEVPGLNVTKQWLDGDGNDISNDKTSVTVNEIYFKLYKVEGGNPNQINDSSWVAQSSEGGTVAPNNGVYKLTRNEDGTWPVLGFENADPNQKYVVYECSAENGGTDFNDYYTFAQDAVFKVTYLDADGNTVSKNSPEAGNGSITITNTIKTVDLTFEKYWEGLVQSEMPDLVVRIDAYAVGDANYNFNGSVTDNIGNNDKVAEVGTYVLTAEHNFQIQLNDLPRYSGNPQKPYLMYVMYELGMTTDNGSTIEPIKVDGVIFENVLYQFTPNGEDIDYSTATGSISNNSNRGTVYNNGGTYTLINVPRFTGFQLAIRKRWHSFTADGGTTTLSDYDGAKFTAMLVQIVKVKNGDDWVEHHRVDYGEQFEWQLDGNTDFMYSLKDGTYLSIRYYNGQWLIVIPEGTGTTGSKLPAAGYAVIDGQIQEVQYDYTVREVSVTSTKDDGYHWAISDHVEQGSAQDLEGTGVSGDGHIWMLDNYEDSQMKIIKHWPVKPGTTDKVYFEVIRKNQGGNVNIVEEMYHNGKWDEEALSVHGLTKDQVAVVTVYNKDTKANETHYCVVVSGATNSTDNWTLDIDHLDLYDIPANFFSEAGGIATEVLYDVVEVAAEQTVDGTTSIVPSGELYIPYYQVTTRGTTGSIRASADGIQLGGHGHPVTTVEVTNNAVTNLKVEKRFFDTNGTTRVDPMTKTDWNVTDDGGNTYTVNKIKYVVKVDVTYSGDGAPENGPTTGYVTSTWKNGEALASDISGAQVFELTLSDPKTEAAGAYWTDQPAALQGLPSVAAKTNGSTTWFETYTYTIVETDVLATCNGQDDISVKNKFVKSAEYDSDSEVWKMSNTRTDVETTDFTFTKQWFGADGNAVAWPDGKEITVTLMREFSYKDTDGTDRTYKGEDVTYTLNASTPAADAGYELTYNEATRSYTFKILNLEPTGTATVAGKTYSGDWVYTVSEAAIDGYTVAYFGSNGFAQNNGVTKTDDGGTIKNTVVTVVLPHTGSIGVSLYYAFGAALAIGAGVLLAARKRVCRKT